MAKKKKSGFTFDLATRIVAARKVVRDCQRKSEGAISEDAKRAKKTLDNLFLELRDGDEQLEVNLFVQQIEAGKHESTDYRKLKSKRGRSRRKKVGATRTSGGVGMYGTGNRLKIWR